jgi:hypothetical protein
MFARKFWLVLILIVLVVIALVEGKLYFARTSMPGGGVACTADAMLCPDGSYVGRTSPNCEFVCPSPTSTAPGDTFAWLPYTDAEYGISLKYPPTWQESKGVMTVTTPYVFFGNPLSGKQTYELKVSVYNNPQNLSAGDYVAQMLASDEAQDASSSAAGPAPKVTPQFEKQYATTVGDYPAYELYGVFEFDHQAEQIYVQQNKQMVIFDFPVADANPNLASPAANNAIAHRIVNTLTLDPAIWKFCGGIAAFQCPTGYSCKLDGTFPDAGGHCSK